ncbi:hypothetical protein ACHAWO_008867 [Cyclotella atomus]|uniref:Roadblock/LAMTOR2 domain-containing protein n=1 Tax=Cyclotella atomus TaxID=382360 RepID=A0ABD3NNW4_9STRA
MSAIEEAERIKSREGVDSYLICNVDGVVFRRHPKLSRQAADALAKKMTGLADVAKDVARDLDPTDDIRILRIKTARKEVLVSREEDFLIVIQQWKPVPPKEN